VAGFHAALVCLGGRIHGLHEITQPAGAQDAIIDIPEAAQKGQVALALKP
jgi:hypothetical protein